MEAPLQNLVYSGDMAGRPAEKQAHPIGAKLAVLRKQAGLSQGQLAEILDIPQRTVSFYEREAHYIPSHLLPRLADTLGVSIEEIIGMNEKNLGKRGPKSRLERQFEKVKTLPKNDQQFVSRFLDQVITNKK